MASTLDQFKALINEPYNEEDYRKKVAEIKEALKREGLYGENLLYLAMNEFMGSSALP